MNTPTAALTLFSNSPSRASGEAFLKFQLARQTPAVFSMKSVQEVTVLPARRLTPMPNMPALMLGLMNRRSRVMWVIDLPQLLGVSTLDANVQQYPLILIQVGSVPLGLAVHQVEGITRLEPEAIQPPPGQIAASLVPYLQGCILQEQDHKQEILLVLDAEAVIQAPVLHNPYQGRMNP
jgi:twitching motility protein PilI